jgi:4-hydroxy-tetrahydrodipicolinate synthase
VSLNLDGLIPATVLPMSAGGVIDEAALRRYIQWIAPQGPVALAINADTGEGPHLTHQEKCRVIEVVAEETDLPIVAGVAGPFQTQAVQQARDYQSAGASALLVFPISAYLSMPLDPRIPVEYHKAIAEVGLPIIAFQLQPMLGGVNFDQETLRQLIGIDGVVAMKEASFDARRYIDTFRTVESTPKYQAGEFTYLTGNDNFILESFMLGCTGALIGFGAIMTREQVDMIEAWNDGRIDDARALGKRVQRLADVIFDAPVANYRVRTKEALHALGVPGLEDTSVRPPLLPIDDAEKQFLAEVLVEVGLLETRAPATRGSSAAATAGSWSNA